MAELHRLNITLSNYFDVAPDIINGHTLSAPSETKTAATTEPDHRLTFLSSEAYRSGYGIKKNIRQQAQELTGNCCFNHVVGLPSKDKREYPMFDYEKILYDYFECQSMIPFKDKHLWVKKATGWVLPNLC